MHITTSCGSWPLDGSQEDFVSAIEGCDVALAIYTEIERDEKIAQTEHMVAVPYEDNFERMKESTEFLGRDVE